MIGSKGIVSHSWYGCHTHILRSDGKLERSTIGAVVFCPSGIYVSVSFKDKHHKTVNKHVSLPSILLLNILWTNIDIVSDTDLDMSEDIDFVPPPECKQLQIFEVTGNDIVLTADQKSALNTVSCELNIIIMRMRDML